MADEHAKSSSEYLWHEIVDFLQEKILKERRSRSQAYWEALKFFWKFCKAGETPVTKRLTARQLMCKILVVACSTRAYDTDNEQAMVNWKQSDWEELMERLAELFQTSNPFKKKCLSELYIACFENKLLAGHRRILEDDIKHKDQRGTVSLSAEEQKQFQKHIRDLLEPVPDKASQLIGECMTSLHETSPSTEDEDQVLILLSPTDLADHLSQKPFLFDWVISKIEAVVNEFNSRTFNGQEATLFQLGYTLPSRFETGQNHVNEETEEQARQGTPSHRTPERTHSPTASQIDRSRHRTPEGTRATPSSSQDDFLQQHRPVVLGSPGEIHHAKPRTPSNDERKRKNPDFFDEDGRAKFRRKWTTEQTNAILAGLRKFGNKANKWSLILNEYPRMFEGRTSVMIKDRFRVLQQAGLIPESLLLALNEK